MKRILPALLLILVLAAAGGAVYYFQKPGRSSSASLAPVSYLPADTLLLLAMPDVDQLQVDWKSTDLYKIWTEPDVQAFLQKPLSLLPPDQNRADILTRIDHLHLKDVFVALTALEEKTNQPHLIGGFQFKGASTDVDSLINPVKSWLHQKFPAGKADLLSYQGHSLETFDNGEGNTLASAYLDDWYLIANDVTLLKTTIDRFDHRTPDTTPSLEKDPDFQAVNAKLPSDYATFVFGRVQPFMTRIFALAAASGQPVDPGARAEAEKMRAAGATTKFENGKIRDTLYYLAPGLKQDKANLQMSSLSLASADTLAYFATAIVLPEHVALPGQGGDPASAAALGWLQPLFDQLQAKGITLAAARTAFGSEASFQLDWPAEHAQPTLVLSLAVRDPAAAAKFLDDLSGTSADGLGWQTQAAGALTLHVLSLPNIDALKPTLASTGKHVILGLNVNSVKEAAAREIAGVPNFTQNEAYKTAIELVEKPNCSVAYLDSRTLFERVYGVVKPMAFLGAAFLFPKVTDYADLTKLPPAEAISKHLSPTVLSISLDPQGQLVESIGSVTAFQALLAVGGATGAVAAPLAQAKYGQLSLLPGFGAAPSASPAPADAGDSPAPPKAEPAPTQ